MKTKKQRIFTALAVLCGILLATALLFWLRPPCLFRRVFGVLCPACGTTRMLSALLRFDFQTAFSLNPFMFCFLPFAGVWLVLEGALYIKGDAPLIRRRWATVLWGISITAGLVFAVFRNLCA